MFKPLPSARRNTRRPSRAVELLESRTLFAVPAGFTETRIATGLAQPVAMAFAPDGRLFVTEKPGGVRVIDANGQLLSQKFMQLTVDTLGERGALGIVHDPDFLTNGHLYVYYTATTPTIHNRLSRFTAADANPDPAVYAPGNTVQAGSETVLMDFDPLSAVYHNAGSLHFGPDGKLYVSVGDNVRGGETQSKNSLWGKILRLNRNGTIPTDNPFYDETTGNNRAIYAMGLRNAFTFAFQPGTGRMFINEVGNYSFEEINEGRPGGNYGWPDTEGPTTDPRFDAPIYSYANNQLCNAITGALFYNPSGGANQLPAEYVGKYFFGDLCGGMDAGTANGWIKTFDPVTREVEEFGTQIQRPVDYDIGPDGAFYYLSNSRPGNAGHVYRVTFSGAATDLNISVQPEDVTASVGADATFSVQAAGSGTITYQWQRNGVNIAGATSPSYTLPDAALGDDGAAFRVVVSNGAQTLTSEAATLTVVNNQPPVPTISLPVTGTQFAGGEPINFAGAADDLEDGALPASAFTWRVDYLTGDIERQGMPDTAGITSGTFTAATQTPFTSTDVRYRVVLTVRDSAGLEASTSVDLHPRVGTINLATSPAGRGLSVTLDGQPIAGGGSSQGVVGVERVLVAPPTQEVNGVSYRFVTWADGVVNSTRTVVTLDSPATLTAVYDNVDAEPPLGTINLATSPEGRGLRLTVDGQAVRGAAAAEGVVGIDRVVEAPATQVVNGVTYQFASWSDGSAEATRTVTTAAQAQSLTANYTAVDDGTGLPSSADLVASVVAPPARTLVGGKRARVLVRLTNQGGAAAAGPVSFTLAASPDAFLDADDVVVATTARRPLRLAPGRSRNVRLNFTPAVNLPSGNSLLLVRADAAGAVAETSEWNNVGATAAPVAMSPATIDLAGSSGAVRLVGTATRHALATLVLRNDGNSAYNGPATISLLASTDATVDDADTLLATLPARTVRIKAAGRRSIRLRADVSSLAAGTYYLVARAPAAGPVADVNPANNTIVSTGTFTV